MLMTAAGLQGGFMGVCCSVAAYQAEAGSGSGQGRLVARHLGALFTLIAGTYLSLNHYIIVSAVPGVCLVGCLVWVVDSPQPLATARPQAEERALRWLRGLEARFSPAPTLPRPQPLLTASLAIAATLNGRTNILSYLCLELPGPGEALLVLGAGLVGSLAAPGLHALMGRALRPLVPLVGGLALIVVALSYQLALLTPFLPVLGHCAHLFVWGVGMSTVFPQFLTPYLDPIPFSLVVLISNAVISGGGILYQQNIINRKATDFFLFTGINFLAVVLACMELILNKPPEKHQSPSKMSISVIGAGA